MSDNKANNERLNNALKHGMINMSKSYVQFREVEKGETQKIIVRLRDEKTGEIILQDTDYNEYIKLVKQARNETDSKNDDLTVSFN